MVIVTDDGVVPVLTETAAENEHQLQERMKLHPELIPIEEFDLTGPMMIIGRETTFLSGAADLLGLTPSGEILVIEFKTGPQNPDFRAALSQVVDYGAQLREQDYGTFEALAVSYFQGKHCPSDSASSKCSTLREAAEKTWLDWSGASGAPTTSNPTNPIGTPAPS